MTTSRSEISNWFDNGVKQGSTHMVIICDTFDYEDFPMFFSGTSEGARMFVEKNNGHNMQMVMEVYNLKMDKEQQLSKHRVFNY